MFLVTRGVRAAASSAAFPGVRSSGGSCLLRRAASGYAGLGDAEFSNITPNVAEKVGRSLHLQEHHPLNTIKTLIETHFASFERFDDLSPVVSTAQCFDELRIPPDHVSRSLSDTYYVTEESVLRPHTSAHQTHLLRSGERSFLVTGDVYRRDEVDASHYPVFHQMEGVRVFEPEELPAGVSAGTPEASAFVERELKASLEGMVGAVFGPVEMRWVDAYFPFTEPSIELEIFFNGDWLEVLGCGVIHRNILDKAGLGHCDGWAFGLGLERLAMVLFGIPDIRLFWSNDPRFSSQFEAGKISAFKPYSKYPPCLKDVTFWVPDEYHVNDLAEVVRGVAGDLAEEVRLLDEFEHPKTGRTSHCYRITYRSMDTSLTNEHIDELQEQVRGQITDELGAELR